MHAAIINSFSIDCRVPLCVMPPLIVSTVGHLGSFQLLVPVDTAAGNIRVHDFQASGARISLGQVPGNGNPGLYNVSTSKYPR